MPTTNDSRAIKINANNPKTKRPLFLFIAAGGLLIALYVMGCQFALLPGGLCGPGNLQANVPATPTPRPITAATQLLACTDSSATVPLKVYEIDCGSVANLNSGAACNADGSVALTLTFQASGEAKQIIEQQFKDNVSPDTSPPGACKWTGLKQVGGAYEAEMTCTVPSGSTLTISKTFVGTSCKLNQYTCGQGYTLVDSLIDATGNLYCVPNADMEKNSACPAGQFYNPQGCCSNATPGSGYAATCGNLTKTADGYQCDYHQLLELVLSFEAPTCAAVAPSRPITTPSITLPGPTAEPTTERTPPPACTPDATGGGCP